MGIDFQAFAKGFLDRSQVIMDENSDEAKEYEKRQRELADRNLGVISKRRNTATAVLSAAKGLSNLGVSKAVIKLAISTPGGLAKLKKEIDTARSDLGKDWDPKLIESFVNLPDEFKNSDALQQDGVSLKDFVYNTHGLTTPTLGPNLDEVAESGGKFSMFDNFFNKNAMEDARTKLGNEMIYGDMSVAQINKLSKQDEYSSQIEGAFLDYKNPKFITADVSGSIRKELESQKDDWRTNNNADLLKLADLRKLYVGTLSKTVASDDNENLRIISENERNYLKMREDLTNSLRLRLETITGPAIETYDEDQFNTKIGGYYKEILKIDTQPNVEATIGTASSDLDVTTTVPKTLEESTKTIDLQLQKGALPNSYVVLDTGSETNGMKVEVYTNEDTGFATVIIRDQAGNIIKNMKDSDGNDEASRFLEKSPDMDFRVRIKEYNETQTKIDPVITTSKVEGVSSAALTAAQTFFKDLNLTSGIDKSELNSATRKYYDNITGKLDKEKIKREVLRWGNKHNEKASEEDQVKVTSFAFGSNQLDELTDNIFNFLMNTQNSEVKTSSISNEVPTLVSKKVTTSGDAPEVTSDFNLDGLGGSTNTSDPIIKTVTTDESIPESENPALMAKPESGTPFIAPDSPEEPGKPINLTNLKEKQDAQKDLSKLPPRSEFMVEFGDEILEALLDRKNITVKNVEAGRLGQLNNVLTAWERKNKGKKISTKDKKTIIKEYIRSKGK